VRGPVAKLFSRVLIERLGLRFPAEASFGEDTIFNFQYLFHCRQVVVGSHVDYVYCDTTVKPCTTIESRFKGLSS
jgi:hypothetical protein